MVTNQDDCKELHGRVFSLMLVVLVPLQGKIEEVLEENNLKANIEQLAE